MATRGIIGRKPSVGVSTSYSDVFGPDYQYSVSNNTNGWPSNSSGTGDIIIFQNSFGYLPFIRYRKFDDGKYYPVTTVDNTPSVSYTQLYSYSASDSITGGSTSVGGNYIAVLGSSWGYAGGADKAAIVYIYKKSPLNSLSDYQFLTTLVNVSGSSAYITGMSLDPTGTYLAIGIIRSGSGSPVRLRIWKRTGDTFSEITAPDPYSLSPTTSLYGCTPTWNKDGSTLSVIIEISPYIVFYNRSGDTFTRLASPATLPTAEPSTVMWNNDGTSVALYGSAVWMIYNRIGNTFTSITGLPTLPGIVASGFSGSWSPSDQLLAIPRGITSTTGSIALYSRSGDTFTLVSNFTTLNNSSKPSYSIFTSSGTELIVGNGPTEILDVSGTTISRPYTTKWGFMHSSSSTPPQTGTSPYVGNGYTGSPNSTGQATIRAGTPSGVPGII